MLLFIGNEINGLQGIIMKAILLICSGLLLIALANLPIGFYTFLRISVTISAVLALIDEYNNGINVWVIIFGIIAVIFNPLLPIYLSDKESWIPIDIITAIIFGIKAVSVKSANRVRS